MNKKVMLAVNVILISAIAYIAFSNGGITGRAVSDIPQEYSYVAYINATDVETGITEKYYLSEKPVYFVPENTESINASSLVLLSSSATEMDADNEGLQCNLSSYVTGKYFEDKNGNGLIDKKEIIVYASETDANGCITAELPEGNYDVIFG